MKDGIKLTALKMAHERQVTENLFLRERKLQDYPKNGSNWDGAIKISSDHSRYLDKAITEEIKLQHKRFKNQKS